MGFFSGWGSTFAALNPVVLGANLLAGGADYLSDEADRRARSDAQSGADANARLDRAASDAQFQKNLELQREFAQNGIRWRVEDAEKAGLHPLAALGAMGASYQPSTSVFSTAGPVVGPSAAGNSYRALSNMGQNIARSVMATQTPAERLMEAEALKKAKLENEFLDVQIKNAQVELAKHAQGPGIPSTTTLMRTPNGQYVVMPSKEFQEAAGGNIFSNAGWWLENKAIPFVTGGRGQFPNALDTDGRYRYFPFANRYVDTLPK